MIYWLRTLALALDTSVFRFKLFYVQEIGGTIQSFCVYFLYKMGSKNYIRFLDDQMIRSDVNDFIPVKG